MSETTTTTPPPTPTDVLLGRVILGLLVVAVLDVLGIVFLAYAERSIPDALVATLGGSSTALAGLLVGRRP